MNSEEVRCASHKYKITDCHGAGHLAMTILGKDKGMKYPIINRQPRREVNVPQLSGGLNLRDSLSGVRDNQMTDCVNMWYKDGRLRTRPGFVTNENMCFEEKIIKDDKYDNVYIADVKAHSVVQYGEAILISCIICDGSYEDGYWQSGIKFYWQYQNKSVSAGYIDEDLLRECICNNRKDIESAANKSSRLVFAKDGYIYLFLNKEGKYFRAYRAQIADELSWDYINWYEYYVPTVYTHCQRTGWDDFKGTQFEGYNLIGNSYKMVYSAYNEADSDKTHPMRYVLGQKLAKSGTIKAEITIYDAETEETKTVVHSIEYSEDDYESFSSGTLVMEIFGAGNTSEDGLRLFVKYNYVGFVFAAQDDGNADKVFFVAMLDNDEKVRKYGCNEDNVVITAQYDMSDDDLKKVFGMTRSVWFGGAANGINDGSRLFLCGNTGDKEKSLVVWSALNNPLYFSENNYAYVGDKSQAVTAFGQQGENLVIFKEKSTYYSYYNINDNITADDLINQTVVDYEANSVIFPMIQLNANIGCDCPNTVQLCRNRLVWTNSDGNVYTLYSNNQYSERTIYKISDMINSILKKENDLKNASSCDFEGHYLLCVGNRIYVMDYNSYGYQYASSFSKNEDSNVQIPWYIWEISDAGKLFAMNNKLIQMNSFDTSDGVMLTFSTLSADENTANDNILIFVQNNELEIIEKKINSRLQTKLFDFSAAGYLKNVDRASIGFGNNGGEPIKVSFLTDKGSESDVVTLVGSSIDERDAAFVTVKNFYVSARAVRTFGVKIECEGPLIIDGLSLQYRMLGGVK